MHSLNEEPCPVPEAVLGQLYSASPLNLAALTESIPSDSRARLAVYCYRRAHLASIGLAIAATCEEQELANHGGNLGEDLFVKSRTAEARGTDTYYERRRKVTLSSGPIMKIISQDLI